MEYTLSEDPLYSPAYRLVVIDGNGVETGIDQSLGRVVCINGIGDFPLSSYTLDPTFARCAALVAELPVIATPPPEIQIPAIPEPSTWLLLAVGLLGAAARKAGRR